MALIKQDFIERIQAEVDIVRVIEAAGIELQKRGSTYFCKSPFNEENTASMAVSPSKQIFKDFSSGKGGGAVNFVMEYFQKSFPEAIEHLASGLNLRVEYEDAEWAKKAAEKKAKVEGLRPILKAAHRAYQQELARLPATHKAWQELRRRGYGREEVTIYGIAYAPGGTFIYDKLRQSGRIEEGRKLGLIGETRDTLWDRVLYPLYDKNGLIVGFAGRDLSGRDKTAKWINSKESEVYRKDKILYGLHLAKQSISRENAVYVVEGYNDVIAWQQNGLLNTVAPCGTAITERHMQLLRRLTDKVVLCMDGDKAGLKSILKYLPELIKRGFSTEVVELDGLDPDDYVREKRSAILRKAVALIDVQTLKEARPQSMLAPAENKILLSNGLPALINEPSRKVNGFKVLLNQWVVNNSDLSDQGKKVSELARIIATVEDTYMKEIYTEWLAKDGKQKPSIVKKLITSAETDLKGEAMESNNEFYELPSELVGKVDLKKMEPILNKYGVMMAENRIWMKDGVEPPYYFRKISNFSIEIIQHMNDEKFPMKLLRIRNVRNQEKIFDVQSDQLISPQNFTIVMSGQGNFLYQGGRNDHMRVLQYLFDYMGDGEKIDVLGWQKSGFFVFNNKVVIPGQHNQEIDNNGVFRIKDESREVSYYVPSANSVYSNNPYKYDAQKKVRVKGGDVSFSKYTSKMMEVHREHAITGILFSVASLFQDIVVSQLGNFPIVFLYGPASTGKDQLIECCQCFFGDPQTAINLEGGVSTAKAQVREMAQFSNLISHLSEYKRGDPKLDGMLKGMWDRRGYKRGTLDSHVGSESIPILSSIFLTGNDYPDNDALITRLVWEEMTKSDFSPAEVRNYEELKDMYQNGVSHLTVELLEFRERWEEQFKSTFRRVSNTLKEDLDLDESQSRIISNLAILASTYELLKDEVQFPFSWKDIVKHFQDIGQRQLRKLNSSSVYNKWWELFLQACRTKQEPLRYGLDYELKDDRLYFNFTNTYNRVAPQWIRLFYESAPGKSKIRDIIQDSEDMALQTHSSHRFRNGGRTSAWSVSLEATRVKKELLETIEWQAQQLNDLPATPSSSPATPENETDGEPSGEKLPF